MMAVPMVFGIAVREQEKDDHAYLEKEAIAQVILMEE
jgi:hypothetical protein